MRRVLALSAASVDTRVNSDDLMSSQRSPSHTTHKKRPSGHTKLPENYGRVSEKTATASQEVALPPPAKNGFKVCSLPQWTPAFAFDHDVSEGEGAVTLTFFERLANVPQCKAICTDGKDRMDKDAT